jgi:hypothetical protein
LPDKTKEMLIFLAIVFHRKVFSIQENLRSFSTEKTFGGNVITKKYYIFYVIMCRSICNGGYLCTSRVIWRYVFSLWAEVE